MAANGSALPSGESEGSEPTSVSRWNRAAGQWRKHVILVPAIGTKPPRLLLNLDGLMAAPREGEVTVSLHIDADPNPSPRDLFRLADDPAVTKFEQIALELAAATDAIAADLETEDIDSTRAEELMKSIRKAPRRPLVEQVQMVEDIDVQARRLTRRLQLMRTPTEAGGVADVHVQKPEPVGEGPKPSRHDSAPTMFGLSKCWRAAVEEWRKYVFTDDARRPARLLLTIPRTPTKGNETTARMFCTDPPPIGKVRRELASQPGLQQFLMRAARLADATAALLPMLKLRGESTAEAEKLVKALRRRPELPACRDDDAVWSVQRKLEAIQNRIWSGALSADEDLRERRAFWQDNLSRLKTRGGLERMDAAVQKILSSPRFPDRELALLNAFQSECHREDLLLVLEPIRMAGGADWLSACRRWQDLVAFGLRFFSHNSHAHGHEVVFFDHLGSTRSMPPKKGATVSPELEWAHLLRGVTENIRPLAEAAGFAAGERVPISKMVQDLDAILAGKAINLRVSVAGVQVLVDEIMAQAKRSRRSALDRFHQIVIEIKDGIARLLHLVSEQSLSHDLMLLDHYVQRVEYEDRTPGPGRSNHVEWCALTKSLCANLKEATVLWNQESGDPARSLRHDFVLKGTPEAKVAILHENSYHGLVLAVARVILDPESPGAVPQDALDEVGVGPNERSCPGVVRRRVVSHMLTASWPPETTHPLEREHAQGLDRRVPGDATGRLPPNPSPDNPACFFRDGDGWTIRYAGQQTWIKHVGGMAHIQQLLMRPGTPIPATELDGLDSGMAESEQLVVEDDGLHAMGDNLAAIEKQLGDETQLLTAEVREQLVKDQEIIASQVRAAASGGHRRTMNSQQEKSRQRVRSAIRRAMNAIKAHHELLWQHLEESLMDRGGANPCYRPGATITWMVNT